VSEEKIEGGRFIDTPDFPKLGYIAAVPELEITTLGAVIPDVSRQQAVVVDKDGKEKVEPMKKRAALTIRLHSADAKKLAALTGHAVGKQVLFMLGDTPLIAPRVMAPISTHTLPLTFSEKADAKKIEDGLKKLIQ
jgi:bifunctional N-acetylglucosamine-1-phosphate-uridyltransferase/glucosamine-1-phosphate-acetyltransferase GlmU-like protein